MENNRKGVSCFAIVFVAYAVISILALVVYAVMIPNHGAEAYVPTEAILNGVDQTYQAEKSPGPNLVVKPTASYSLLNNTSYLGTAPKPIRAVSSNSKTVTKVFATIEGEEIPLTGKDLYISYIYEIHDKYYPNLDTALVQAVMKCESNYTPTVQSHCGAVGLMQVLPKYHAWRMEQYGLTDIWDPYTNIIVGMDFLNESYVKYGSNYAALRAYGGTDKYARYVLGVAEQIRQGGG